MNEEQKHNTTNFGIVIEPVKNKEGMEAAKNILLEDGIALIAIGSVACVRALYLQALRLKRLPYLYIKALTAQDYCLGCNENAVKELLAQALQRQDVRGIIIYASCLDKLSYWSEDAMINDVENPNKVPINILYRGPLVKRCKLPTQALKEIWQQWKLEHKQAHPFGEAQNVLPQGIEVPEKADFEKIIWHRAVETRKPCNILILTPGGCGSCIDLSMDMGDIRLYTTRFDDIIISNCSVEWFKEAILKYFDATRTLVLLPTAVIKTVGLDLTSLCNALQKEGMDVVLKPTGGFAY